ncbi:MAG TPA: GNAT family N-acetyltransferase [Burkholderiales bacterium]
MIVREALAEDLRGVLKLYAQPELDDGQRLPLEDAEALFGQIRAHPHYRLYVAEDRGRIVGTFTLLISRNLSHLGVPSVVVESVAVAPGLQGEGVGRRMMAFALDICRRAGCYKMALSSSLRRSRAHAFYEGLGFERHGYSFQVAP